MKDKFLQQTKREYSPNQRLAALAVEGVFFLVIAPFVLITLGSSLDQWLQWSPIRYEPINLILGGLLCVASWLLGLWANYAQFTLGRGTPVPLMATQKLIVEPPYTYCRNPMALGAIGMYLGVAIVFGSIGAVVLVLLGAAVLLTYIKRVEEKEMELRFGQEYLAYKQRTPFLIPHR
ncbi:MAG: isoprenylcysteine carboxylmethyltransferase family protein [Chloroflexi bacterium]|nr:isoprenylcysteine carboxylmethyltransferase family protein [Chloroflexota bacterium]